MSKYRRNAVVIDYNVLPVRPDIEAVSKFISNDLQLDLKRVKNLQLNNSRNHVIIELGSPEEASDLAERHNLKHKVGCRGKLFRIPIFLEDNSIQVRVHDLPPHMPNEIIATHLEAYGEVNSIRREVWREYFPGIPNGVRVVRMVLEKPIPSFIKVEEEVGYILYNQQVKTCRHCAKPLHHGKKCDENLALTPTTTTTTTPPAAQLLAPTLPALSAPTSTPSATAIEKEITPEKTLPEIAPPTTTTFLPSTSVKNHQTTPSDQTMDISPEDDDDNETAKTVKPKRRSRRKKPWDPHWNHLYDDW
ncbi:uncharacterized protein LOC120423036 [Culex pipiens pallens]|uniref:uncharacterized protein LOC120423036 n=1 Tax=Culex pipiens pallens TaxID=42434 RepID=UPI0019540DA8|nr:uncharacterized protein LOC120423036 [Culex pipiens pallens]